VPLITTLFFHGAFTANDVLMTRNALLAYSIGLLGLILVKVLAPGFYARQNVRTPVRIAIISLCTTQLLNLVLVGWLQHAGLALAISLAAVLNASLLFRGLRQSAIYVPQPGWLLFYARLGLAMLSMGAALWFTVGEESAWLSWTLSQRLLRLSMLVSFGAGVYFATLWIAGFRLRDFKRSAAE
jgi:putative peptidoglycan lipid II flippase